MHSAEQIKLHILCAIKDHKWSWHWYGIVRALQSASIKTPAGRLLMD